MRFALTLIRKFKGSISDISSIPIGISKNTLSVESYDLTSNQGTVISSNNIKYTVNFVKSLLMELKAINNVEPLIFDANNSLNLNNDIFMYYYNQDFDVAIDNVLNIINSNNQTEFVICINAISNLINKSMKTQSIFDAIKGK